MVAIVSFYLEYHIIGLKMLSFQISFFQLILHICVSSMTSNDLMAHAIIALSNISLPGCSRLPTYHLICFQIMETVNKVAKNIYVQMFSLGIRFQLIWIIPRTKLMWIMRQDHVYLCKILINCLSKPLCPFKDSSNAPILIIIWWVLNFG
jgi:hypothetical protein